MAGPDLDVVVVGDGPAGLALAAACRGVDLRVAVFGDGLAWPATYGMWCDEVPLAPSLFSHISRRVVVEGHRRHDLDRPYGIIDNRAVRAWLARGVDVAIARAHHVQHFGWGSRVVTATGAVVDAGLVVDATGRPPALVRAPPTAVAQSAFGIVLPAPPPGFDRAAVTLLDLRPLPDAGGLPTFCYVVPVADGWLVEETVLARRPPVPPGALRDRLAARIGPDGQAVIDGARRVEEVVVPMGGRRPSRRQAVVGFGAAAGMTHPATGFSVAAALRAAPRVARAIADGAGRADPMRVWDAVWPRPARLTRHLHDYGLEVLLRMDQDQLARFFDAFFDLRQDSWAAYLRIDAPPGEVVTAMTGVLRRLPWAMRRRLVVGPRAGS